MSKVVVDVEMAVPEELEDASDAQIVTAVEEEFRTFIEADAEVTARVE